jgi:hypothetical protein
MSRQVSTGINNTQESNIHSGSSFTARYLDQILRCSPITQRNIMQRLRYSPVGTVDLESVRGLPAEQWTDSDIQNLAKMLQRPYVFANGRWRKWECYFGDQEDAAKGDTDRPHVMVIGEAISRHLLRQSGIDNPYKPSIEFLIPHELGDGAGQWGFQVQHMARMRELGDPPQWVQEMELCWWHNLGPGVLIEPDHMKSPLAIQQSIARYSKTHLVYDPIDFARSTHTLATSLGASSFDIQSQIAETPVDELKRSYLLGRIQNLQLDEQAGNQLYEQYRQEGDDRSSREHGFELLQNLFSLEQIANAIASTVTEGLPYGVNIDDVLTTAGTQNAPDCLARSMSSGGLMSLSIRQDLPVSFAASVLAELRHRGDSQMPESSSGSTDRRQ